MIHWKQIKLRKYAYSSKTLLMNALNNGRVNPSPAVRIRSFNRITQSKSMHIMPRGHIGTNPSISSYFIPLSLEYPKDRDSSSVVRSLIGLFAFRSHPVSKVYQHLSRNGGILEVAWSTGCPRKKTLRHCCWGVNTRSIFATC